MRIKNDFPEMGLSTAFSDDGQKRFTDKTDELPGLLDRLRAAGLIPGDKVGNYTEAFGLTREQQAIMDRANGCATGGCDE